MVPTAEPVDRVEPTGRSTATRSPARTRLCVALLVMVGPAVMVAGPAAAGPTTSVAGVTSGAVSPSLAGDTDRSTALAVASVATAATAVGLGVLRVRQRAVQP